MRNVKWLELSNDYAFEARALPGLKNAFEVDERNQLARPVCSLHWKTLGSFPKVSGDQDYVIDINNTINVCV